MILLHFLDHHFYNVFRQLGQEENLKIKAAFTQIEYRFSYYPRFDTYLSPTFIPIRLSAWGP